MGQILNKLRKTKTNFNDLPPETKTNFNDLPPEIKTNFNDLPPEIKTNFNDLPREMKEDILSYLCDSNAFTAAAVCEEWKEILGTRFTGELDTVIIGMHKCCHSYYRCLCNDCVKAKGSMHLPPEEMLKAAADHKLNVHLRITETHDVTEVDSKVVTKGLLSVSRFTLEGRNPLSFDQLEDLFKALEKRDKLMEEVNLFDMDLNKLNQDRLVHCLVDKIKNLTLDTDDVKPMKLKTVKKLFNNIITRPVNLKSLTLELPFFKKAQDFSTLINQEDLKMLLNKMDKISLEGRFTSEQIEAAKSLPDVEVSVGRPTMD